MVGIDGQVDAAVADAKGLVEPGSPLQYQLIAALQDLLTLLNSWIDLRRRDGSIERRYDYWVRGLHAEEAGPRWSVIRNALGWVD